MKTKVFSILITVFSLAFFTTAFSQTTRQEPKFKKQKSYTKSYNVSSNDRITLENQFGEMKLNTWDRNEVKVDVSITGMSDDEARAQQILDRISIVDDKTGNGVSFKTKLAEHDKDWNKNNNNKNVNESMKINYTVYLPAGNPLTAKNQFGALIVPDYRGEATIESQFGSLTAGKITNAKKITVGFGKADIAQINNGKVTISYSSGSINKLVGNVDLKFEFSSPVKVNIDNDIESLDIDNSYSTVYLDLSKNLSASYNVSNSFSTFKNKSNFNINTSNEKNNSFNTTSSGTSGNGNKKINIKSSFSTVNAGHDLQVDTSKKKKTATI